MEILKKTRDFLLSFETRLLERQLFLTIFENQNRNQVIKAIISYQNDDGGFGNGIEPDLMTPESTAIGLETALYYFDCISEIPPSIQKGVLEWLNSNLSDDGKLAHPPSRLEQYPFQPWWKNSDDYRIFSITALLKKLGVQLPEALENRIQNYAVSFNIPDEIAEYDYPVYLYIYFTDDFPDRKEILESLKGKFELLCHSKPDHHLLFSRYWKFFYKLFDKEFIESEIHRIKTRLQDHGELPHIYPALPWWNTIFTLDSLIALKQFQL